MSYIKKIKLITINERPATTSHEIAKHFNKRHGNVLRDIENLDCSPQFTQLNFELSEYKDRSGKACKEYIIFRDGFIFLTMGFKGELAGKYKEAYINSFNRMERELQNHSQTALQQGKPKIDDILNSAVSLEKVLLEISYTKQGDIINVNQLEQSPEPVMSPKEPTIFHKPSWIQIVETFFDEIHSKTIPKEMCQNMLISKVSITLARGKRSNMIACFLDLLI